MAKEKVAPFKTVKAFLKTQEAFEKAKGLLDANLKFLKKRFGTTGGNMELPDGELILTASEPNGRDSVAYKGIVEAIEAEIRSGAMYQRNKEDQIAFLESLKAEHTKPQMASQKVEAEENGETADDEDTILVICRDD